MKEDIYYHNMKLLVRKIFIWTIVLSMMTGAAASGYSTVICISEDGQAELESFCMPCCSEEEEQKCSVEDIDIKHDDHDDDSSCSDVEIDYTFIGKRTHKIQAPQSVKNVNLFTSSVVDNNLAVTYESNDQKNNFEPPLTDPRIIQITSVILTC